MFFSIIFIVIVFFSSIPMRDNGLAAIMVKIIAVGLQIDNNVRGANKIKNCRWHVNLWIQAATGARA